GRRRPVGRARRLWAADCVPACANGPRPFLLGRAPAHGGVSIVSRSGLQGSAVYTPDSGYSGRDSFTYTVTDARGLTSAPATVRLLVVSSRRRRSAEEFLNQGPLSMKGPWNTPFRPA